MGIVFQPTLQHIAYVKVARGVLYAMDMGMWTNRLVTLESVMNDYAKIIQEKISTIILPVTVFTLRRLAYKQINSTDKQKYSTLPTKIQKTLAGIVMALGLEIVSWYNPMRTYLNKKLDIRNILSWSSIGFIDRFETVRVLIQNKDVMIKYRFFLACKYFFEKDVQKLWAIMPEANRTYFEVVYKHSISIQYWLKALTNSTTLDWEQMLHSIGEEKFFNQNFLGIRYYFAKLPGPEIRQRCILTHLKCKWINYSDVYLCLSQLNDEELNSIFTRLSRTHLYYVFRNLLQWPFQFMFLDVIKSFKSHITEKIFHDLIIFILNEKINKARHDHQYVDLLENFWNSMSPHFGYFVERNEKLKTVLQYVFDAPVPFNVKDYKDFISAFYTKEPR
ncbi:uncharacterized protein NPIL_436931 [Nephila pilipes]|uniref:Uncharacterized protein n=1 Tax=Nephila pilipes TaxID=299642 RepID=A0A8X6ISQ4_NEPPI|nr:uncharacterized protein NPIL_436931 [Nephila pilipes]